MKEEWRDVPGFPGYRVSDRGRVRGKSGKIMSPQDNGRGYKKVAMRAGGPPKQRYLHRVVLQSFLGDPPPGKSQAAHINGDRAGNRLSNLSWCDQSENELHKNAHGTGRRGSKHPLSVLDESAVIRIKKRLRAGDVGARIARDERVSCDVVYQIKRGNNWGWLDA